MKDKLPLLLPFRCIICILIFVVGAAVSGKNIDEISNWWSAAASAVNIITIALLVIIAKKENSTYAELINYQKGQTKIRKAILLIIGFVIIGMGGMYLSGLICYGTIMPAVSLKLIAPIPAVLAVLNIIILPVTTALAEDGLYLGGGVSRIENKYLSVIVPAFFYALQHCFIPVIFDARYMLYRFISFLPLTVIFCIFYQKKKDPLPVMIAHAILDLATAMSILSTSVIPGAYDQMCSM